MVEVHAGNDKNKTKQNMIGNMTLKPEFWTPDSKSWDSTCQLWPLTPICQIKRHSEGQRKEVCYRAVDML
jgi:hypothetical protein